MTRVHAGLGDMTTKTKPVGLGLASANAPQQRHQQVIHSPRSATPAASQADAARDRLPLRADPDAAPQRRQAQCLREADLLVRASQPQAALNMLLHTYDLHRHDLGVSSHESTALLRRIVQLGHQYPPAIEALVSRRDRLEALIIDGIGDRSTVTEFHAINRTLLQTDRTVDLFRRLHALGPRQRQMQTDLAMIVLEHLVEQRRYAAALEQETIIRARLGELFANYQALQRQTEPLAGLDGLLPAGLGPDLTQQVDAEPPQPVADVTDSPIDQVRHRALHLAGLYFEALLGIGDLPAVEGFVSELQHVFRDHHLRPALTSHVLRVAPDAIGLVLGRLAIAHDS